MMEEILFACLSDGDCIELRSPAAWAAVYLVPRQHRILDADKKVVGATQEGVVESLKKKHSYTEFVALCDMEFLTKHRSFNQSDFEEAMHLLHVVSTRGDSGFSITTEKKEQNMIDTVNTRKALKMVCGTDGLEWVPCSFLQLKKGDRFKIYEEDGTPVAAPGNAVPVFEAASDGYIGVDGVHTVQVSVFGAEDAPDTVQTVTNSTGETFVGEVERLINKYSLENGSDTPDFILAKYLQGCLEVFNATVQERERWYGRTKQN